MRRISSGGLTCAGIRQASHIGSVGVVAGKRAVRVVILVVPHGAQTL